MGQWFPYYTACCRIKGEQPTWRLINALLDKVTLSPVLLPKDALFTQCIYRKVIELGFKKQYEEADGVFAHSIRQLSALAFIPAEDVAGAYFLLRQSDRFDQRAVPLFFIFWRYLGWSSRRQPSTLVPYFIVECVPSNIGRRATNNDLEGWHTSLQSKFNCPNPVFKCIKALKKEQGLISARVVSYASVSSSSYEYSQKRAKNQNNCERYPTMEKLEYLSAFARNYKFWCFK